MKRTILTMMLAVILSMTARAQLESVKELTLNSEYFNFQRQVLVYTPVNYAEFTETEYDVIYVFDAQQRAMFDLVHCLLDVTCVPDPDLGRTPRYIIVGICSPNLPKQKYYRNNDYLPQPIHGLKGRFSIGYGFGNSADLKKFVKNELMPYVDAHYRTSGHTIGVGHSLSASFVLDAMVTDELFDDYIAISPNCGYDEYRLAEDVTHYPFMNRKAPRFLYTSMSNEIIEGHEYFGDDWRKGWEQVSTFLKDTTHLPSNTVASVQSFPAYDHWRGYLPSLTAALNEYTLFCTTKRTPYIGDTAYPVHIELHGHHLTDSIYITGNQDALANWNPQGIKMKLQSDSVATIDLNLRLPAQFKFTRGSWEKEALIGNADSGNLIINRPDGKAHIYRLYERQQWADKP